MNQKQQNKSKVLTLATCFGISILLWLASNFSHQYEKEITVQISYIDVPNDKLLDQPISTIYTTINTTGWSLLFAELDNIEIHVKWEDFDENGLLSIPNTENFVQQVLPKSRIVKIHPTNIKIQAKNLANKSVPINLLYEVNGLPENFHILQPPSISQDSIMIFGSIEKLNTITTISTEQVLINNSEIHEQNVALEKIDNVQYEENNVVIKYRIEEFSEKEIISNVNILNAPQEIEFSIFPEQIELKALLPFSEYEKISAEDFIIQADFNNIDVRNDKKLVLTIEKQPKTAKNVSISPEQLEFIIYQNE